MPHEVDISWMAEHAKQVLRLLPDSLTVLGFFLAQSDSFLVANDGTCTVSCVARPSQTAEPVDAQGGGHEDEAHRVILAGSSKFFSSNTPTLCYT